MFLCRSSVRGGAGLPNDAPDDSGLVPALRRIGVEGAGFVGEERNSIAAFRLWGCGERYVEYPFPLDRVLPVPFLGGLSFSYDALLRVDVDFLRAEGVAERMDDASEAGIVGRWFTCWLKPPY